MVIQFNEVILTQGRVLEFCYSARPVVSAQWSAHSGQPTVVSPQKSAHSGQSTVVSPQWSAHGGQSTVDSPQWSVYSGQSNQGDKGEGNKDGHFYSNNMKEDSGGSRP